MKQNCTIQLQLKARYLPYLVALVLLLQLIVPYKGWMILLVGLGGAWLLSYLWARSLAQGLKLTREMRYGWAQVGDKLQERFTLSNKGRAWDRARTQPVPFRARIAQTIQTNKRPSAPGASCDAGCG